MGRNKLKTELKRTIFSFRAKPCFNLNLLQIRLLLEDGNGLFVILKNIALNSDKKMLVSEYLKKHPELIDILNTWEKITY